MRLRANWVALTSVGALVFSCLALYETSRPRECSINTDFIDAEHERIKGKRIGYKYTIVRHYGEFGDQKSLYRIEDDPIVTVVIKLIEKPPEFDGAETFLVFVVNCALDGFPGIKPKRDHANGQ